MRTVHFFATYFEQEHKAFTLINSLRMQTADNWKLTICSNGDKSLNNVKDAVEKLGWADPQINFKITEENSGYWGALNRKAFIQNELSDSELLVNTSVEDYYVPKTVEFINSRDEDFIMWDFTHHHFGYDLFMCISQPRAGRIDWGNYALAGGIAKQVEMMPFERIDPKNPENKTMVDPWKEFMGDGLFIEALFKKFPKISNVRLPKVLFIKN